MDEKNNLHVNCSCFSCQQLSEAEKKLHIEISQNSRREFFKTAGKLGLGIGIGGGLISPLAASTLNSDESDYKARTLEKSKVLQNGKAQMLTLLHTADIHYLIFMMNFLLKTEILFIKREVVLLR
jgi:sulfur-oxidizing protein SoxB